MKAKDVFLLETDTNFRSFTPGSVTLIFAHLMTLGVSLERINIEVAE